MHRQAISEQLSKDATEKAAWPVQDEMVRAQPTDQQIKERDGDAGMIFHEPSAPDGGKAHLTTMREVNVDKKYSIGSHLRHISL